MRNLALSILLLGGLTASSTAFAAHGLGGLGGMHGLSSPGLSISRSSHLSPFGGEFRTNRLLNRNAGLGSVGSSCNMPSYPADSNCQ